MTKRKSTKAIGDNFAHRIAGVYRDLGFVEVQEDVNLDGHAVDIVARQHIPGIGMTILAVECKTSMSSGSRPIGKEQALKWANEVADLRRNGTVHLATMIASQGFTRQAKELLAANRISALSVDELTASAVNPAPYVERFIIEYENWTKYASGEFLIRALSSANLEKIFIQRSALLDPSSAKKSVDDLDEFLIGTKSSTGKFNPDGWIAKKPRRSSSCIALLADFGVGKTSYLLHLSYMLCKLWRNDASWPLPVFVPLNKFLDPSDVKQVLASTALGYGISFSSVDALIRLVRDGRILPIFDGVDETLTRGDFTTIRSRFESLGALAEDSARCIVSCRASLFRNDSEMHRARIGSPRRPHELLSAQSPTQGYLVIQLQNFSRTQVEEFVRKANPENASTILKLLEENRSLAELSTTPVFLDMIVKTAPAIRGRPDVKISSLYAIYADSWILREDKANNSLPPQAKEILLEELAYAVSDRRPPTLKVSELRQFLIQHQDSASSVQSMEASDLDWLEHDMRTCAFLTRDGDGNYGFAHRSFQSYFLARWHLRRLTHAKTPVSIGTAIGDAPIGPLVIMRRDQSHWGFLEELLTTERIQELIEICRGSAASDTRFACTNLVSLLLLRSTATPQFKALPLPALYCASEDLTGSDFSECDLRHAVFHSCILDGAKFAGANLDDAYIKACWLDGSNFESAKLERCDIDMSIRAHSLCEGSGWIAVGGAAGQIQLFSGARFVGLLRNHHDIVTTLALSSSRLASGGYADRSVSVTDLTTGSEVFRVEHPDLGNIESVHFSRDGRTLFYTEYFGTVFALATDGWRQLWSKSFGQNVDWAFLMDSQLLLIHYDSVRFVDVGAGESIRAFSIPEDYGREYAIGQGYLALSYLPSDDSGYRVALFELRTGNVSAEWDCPTGLQISEMMISAQGLFVATEPEQYGPGSGRAKVAPEEMLPPSVFVFSLASGILAPQSTIDETVAAMFDCGDSILAATVDGRILAISGEPSTSSQVLIAGAYASNVLLAGAAGAASFSSHLRFRPD